MKWLLMVVFALTCLGCDCGSKAKKESTTDDESKKVVSEDVKSVKSNKKRVPKTENKAKKHARDLEPPTPVFPNCIALETCKLECPQGATMQERQEVEAKADPPPMTTYRWCEAKGIKLGPYVEFDSDNFKRRRTKQGNA